MHIKRTKLKQTALDVQLSLLRKAIFHVIVFCFGMNSFAQTHDPLSLHFQKEYQVRNSYNSFVTISKLDLSQDVLNESTYPRIHLTSPGCDFKQDGQVLLISNNSGKVQESHINLGKLNNYACLSWPRQNAMSHGGFVLSWDEESRRVKSFRIS